MAIAWAKEARDFAPDPVSGATITRLTGSSIRTGNIFCEAPRATRDGSRFAAIRYMDGLLSPGVALLCVDITTKFTCLIDREVNGVVIGPAWGGALYYRRGTMLMRASLATCTTEPLLDMATMPHCWQMMSVSHDERYLLYTATVRTEPEEAYNLARLDLQTGQVDLLLDEPDTNRMGAAYNPVAGYNMIQARTFWEGDSRFGVGVLADGDGRPIKTVYSKVHHACQLGNTGKFAGLLPFDYQTMGHLPENPDGELVITSADDTPPRLIPIPEHILYHISSSICGRYVVSETLETCIAGPVPIIIVNVETGKYRTLVADCGSPGGGGGDAARQPKPYFTADSRHIIYTAEPDCTVNVYAAGIPDGFLASLD